MVTITKTPEEARKERSEELKKLLEKEAEWKCPCCGRQTGNQYVWTETTSENNPFLGILENAGLAKPMERKHFKCMFDNCGAEWVGEWREL